MEYREKKMDLEREKNAKVGVARRYRTRTGKAPGCGPVRARTVGALLLQQAKISVFIYGTSSQSLTAKVLQVGFLTLIKLF